MTGFTIATFNLYQWAQPGTYWYRREADSTNDPTKHWEPKRAFLANLLAEANADVIGFQEVFSHEDLADFMRDQGYPWFSIVISASRLPQDPDVFAAPTVAIASRFEIRSVRAVAPRPDIEVEGLLAPDFDYRRDVLAAEISVPGLAEPMIVHVCHFKSQGAFVDADAAAALPEWDQRFRYTLHQRALRTANQIIRRAGEAMMLYDHVMALSHANPKQGVVVMGDLNAPPDSITTRILTQSEQLTDVARRKVAKLASAEKRHLYSNMLYDTRHLTGQTGALAPTHFYWSGGSVLDYVLVNNALNANNKVGHVAYPERAWLIDAHLSPGDRRVKSDHAAVVTHFALRGVGQPADQTPDIAAV